MIVIVVAGFVLLADQLTKTWIRHTFSLGESIPIIKNVFHLTYVKNTGAAFGLFPNQQPLFLIATVLVIIFILFYYRQIKGEHQLVKIALGLELGGAWGNLTDRLLFSRVTDFLDFRIWPVFNLADSAIVVGLVLLVGSILVSWIRGRTVSGR